MTADICLRGPPNGPGLITGSTVPCTESLEPYARLQAANDGVIDRRLAGRAAAEHEDAAADAEAAQAARQAAREQCRPAAAVQVHRVAVAPRRVLHVSTRDLTYGAHSDLSSLRFPSLLTSQ